MKTPFTTLDIGTGAQRPLTQGDINAIMGEPDQLSTHYSVERGICACGENRTDAYQMTAQLNIIEDYEDKRGAVLPEGMEPGQPVIVVNASKGAVRIYGPEGGKIDGLDADYGVSLAPGERVRFIAIDEDELMSEMLGKAISSYGAKKAKEDGGEKKARKPARRTKKASAGPQEPAGGQDGSDGTRVAKEPETPSYGAHGAAISHAELREPGEPMPQQQAGGTENPKPDEQQ